LVCRKFSEKTSDISAHFPPRKKYFLRKIGQQPIKTEIANVTHNNNNFLCFSLEQDPLLIKPELYKTPQDTWFESEYNRLQKEKFMQSLAVPDPSLDYSGYYLNYEGSIYEPDPVQTLPLPNPITEKSPAFTGFQRVPKIEPTYNAPSPIATSPILKQKSSRPRLCHFLLELLANPAKYSDIVEWVDQDNGVFKFLNSSEVASQWGRRRNKPHMKYENFARSLRTYIAKGILTKPRSKLVYRFTSQVY
jgi:hypothetical protein